MCKYRLEAASDVDNYVEIFFNFFATNCRARAPREAAIGTRPWANSYSRKYVSVARKELVRMPGPGATKSM